MKNPFDILQIEHPNKKLSKEEIKGIKLQYRKLAMIHHPDKGGDPEKFKEIQSAWEQIERGEYSQLKRWKSIDEFILQTQFPNLPNVIIRCALQEAYYGFTTRITVDTPQGPMISSIKIAPQLPCGHSKIYTLDSGIQFIGILKIECDDFLITTLGAVHSRLNSERTGAIADTGFLEKHIDVDALDIMVGSWVTLTDFLGKKFSIRIPAGFCVKHRLKAAGKGYYDFDIINDKPIYPRGDLYIIVNPVFSAPDKMDKQKVAHLYNLTNGYLNDADSIF